MRSFAEWLWPNTDSEEQCAAAARSASLASVWIVIINAGVLLGFVLKGRSEISAVYADAAGIACFILFMRSSSGSLISALFALAAAVAAAVLLYLAVVAANTLREAPASLSLAPVFLAGAVWGVRGSLILKWVELRRSGWLAALMGAWWPDVRTKKGAGAAAMGGVWALLWLAYLNGLVLLPALMHDSSPGAELGRTAGVAIGSIAMPIAVFLAMMQAVSRSPFLAWTALAWIAGDTVLRLAGIVPGGPATPLNLAFSVVMVLAAAQGVRGAAEAAKFAPMDGLQTEAV